ncbi:DUF6431 domain-containing protein [Georgenia yuyongxinii]
MVLILRPATVGQPAPASDAHCPGCGDTLVPWGYARARSVRDVHGTRVLRPRRGRCRGCRVTHVLLPAAFLPRRADTIEVIGQALLAAATGASHRTISADLHRPTATVRGWIRAAVAGASRLREHATVLAHRLDPLLPPIQPAGTPLADAIEALGVAAIGLHPSPRLAWFGVGTDQLVDQRPSARPDRPGRLTLSAGPEHSCACAPATA